MGGGGLMREYPVFLPDGDEHVAAVLTAPERSPRGLVLLVTGGGGTPRSHRASMFTRVARELADRGIASLRVDVLGVGDSTGRAAFSLREPPIEAILSSARFAIDVTGVRILGMAGNCGGARTTLEVVQRIPGFQSVALMFVKPHAVLRSVHPAVQWAKRSIKGVPRLGKLAKKLYWRTKARHASSVVDKLEQLAGKVHLLMLEGKTEKAGRLLEDGYGLTAKNGKRLEIHEMPGGAQRAFRLPERQQYTIDMLVRWFDETLPAEPAPGTEDWLVATSGSGVQRGSRGRYTERPILTNGQSWWEPKPSAAG
jgi:pimeloyl-ACP methyl ester carboxylesterase